VALPPPPENVIATPKGPGEVEVTWEPGDPSAGTAFEVRALPTRTRHTADRPPRRISGLEADVSYTSEVRAVTSDGKSEPKLSGSVTAPSKPSESVVRHVMGLCWAGGRRWRAAACSGAGRRA
jgi:Fibronectin type III domain